MNAEKVERQTGLYLSIPLRMHDAGRAVRAGFGKSLDLGSVMAVELPSRGDTRASGMC